MLFLRNGGDNKRIGDGIFKFILIYVLRPRYFIDTSTKSNYLQRLMFFLAVGVRKIVKELKWIKGVYKRLSNGREVSGFKEIDENLTTIV